VWPDRSISIEIRKTRASSATPVPNAQRVEVINIDVLDKRLTNDKIEWVGCETGQNLNTLRMGFLLAHSTSTVIDFK
jgi:hypothetical protein